MSSIEYIVRPYQSPLSGGVIIPATPGKSRERAVLTWGAKSDMPEPQMPTVNVACCNEGLKEHDRKSEPVRVYQDGDKNSPNYVDYARPTTITHNKHDQKNCFGETLGWTSTVESSLDAIDDEWSGLFDEFDSTDEHCKVSWTFQYKNIGLPGPQVPAGT